jgi:hypothetical protein
MAGRRLSIGRIAAITAWTGAAVAWGTAVVSVAAANPDTAVEEPVPEPVVAAPTTTVLAPVPNMPDSGLIVVRYTPVARPEPVVIIERRVVQVASPSQPQTKTKTKSSGS